MTAMAMLCSISPLVTSRAIVVVSTLVNPRIFPPTEMATPSSAIARLKHEMKAKATLLRIRGFSQYERRKLLNYGGVGKEENPSAKEGSKTDKSAGADKSPTGNIVGPDVTAEEEARWDKEIKTYTIIGNQKKSYCFKISINYMFLR